MTDAWRTLATVLHVIHARLDERLDLRTLAGTVDISPFRMHRLFRALLGETPRAYVERQRLERARFRMLVQEASLTRIALDCGFESPDTFSRAFRRRFGESPARWRTMTRRARREPDDAPTLDAAGAMTLSATRAVRLQTLNLATIRHVGPYESVPESLFDRLAAWATARAVPGPRVWMGIGHDAPSMTPPEALRFDAALVVADPFEADGDVVHRVLPGGDFALTTHVGSYTTLPAAYGEIMQRLLRNARWTPRGLPAVEIYHTAQVAVGAAINHTDVCLPIDVRE